MIMEICLSLNMYCYKFLFISVGNDMPIDVKKYQNFVHQNKGKTLMSRTLIFKSILSVVATLDIFSS